MKKLLTVLIAVAITMSCTACGNSEELEALREENEELKKLIGLDPSQSVNVSVDVEESTNPPKETTGTPQKVIKVESGKQIKVQTKKGDYGVTLLNAHKAVSVEDKGNYPIIVSLEIENISYVYDEDETYFMPWSPYKGYIKVSDNKKNILKYYDCSGPTELNNPQNIPVGYKECAKFAFFPNTPNVMPESITVQVYNGNTLVGTTDIAVTE